MCPNSLLRRFGAILARGWGCAGGEYSISQESIEACSEKMLLEIRVAASNNQARAVKPYT
jgi:hypothetical protein